MGFKKFLLVLPLAATVLVGCTSETSDPEQNEPTESVVTKSLEVVTQPTKTVYKRTEYVDYSGLVVEKVDTTDGVETSRTEVALEELTFSVAQGEQLTEVTEELAVEVSLLDDPQGVYGSTFVYLTVTDLDKVSVTFKNYDDTVLEVDAVYEGETTTYDGETPTKPSSQGYYYEFQGWYLEEDDTEELIDLSTYVFTEDTVLYAKYVEQEIPSNDGTLLYVLNDDGDGYNVYSYLGTSTEVVVPDTHYGIPVVGINDSVFQGQSDITSVTLGANVKAIGASSFRSMTNESLTIQLNEGLETIGDYAFRSSTGLTSLTIPSTVTTIGTYAFAESKITSAVLPESLTSLGTYAYDSCAELQSVEFKGSLDTIPQGTFWDATSLSSIVWPSDLVTIATSAFRNTGFTTIQIPEGVVSIGTSNSSYVFYNMANLETVVLPSTLTYIGGYAFGSNSKLTTINIPDGVTTIGSSCFSGSPNVQLPSVFPDSLTTIGNSAFYGNTTMTEFTLGTNVSSVGTSVFSGATALQTFTWNATEVSTISASMFYNTTSLKTFNTGEGVTITTINSSAFYNSGIESTPFDMSNVTSIASSAFRGCTQLASFELPTNTSFTIINQDTFWGTGLQEITIPANVATLGIRVFREATSLTKVTIQNKDLSITTNTTAYTQPFYGCTSLSEVVFNGTMEESKAIIEATDTSGTNTFFGETELPSVKITCNDGTWYYSYSASE